METSKKLTTGTCTAEILDQDITHTFDGVDFTFHLDSKQNWRIYIFNERIFFKEQSFTFVFPDKEDITNETYPLTIDGSQGFASWTKDVSGATRAYNSISGSVTVTLDRSKQTIEASFNFEGRAGHHDTVTVKNGHMKLEGFSHLLETTATGSVEGDVSGSVTRTYRSTEVTLRKEPAFGNFPAHLVGWSQDYPDETYRERYVLALRFIEKLQPGTYSISPESEDVLVSFIDIESRYSYSGVSGTIELKSMPDPDTVKGELSGTFNCRAVSPGSDYSVEIKNGRFSITT